MPRDYSEERIKEVYEEVEKHFKTPCEVCNEFFAEIWLRIPEGKEKPREGFPLLDPEEAEAYRELVSIFMNHHATHIPRLNQND